MSFHHIPCGECFFCERRMFSQCKLYKTTGLTAGFTPNGGGFGEYVKTMPWGAERGIIKLPDNVSFEEATFLELDVVRQFDDAALCYPPHGFYLQIGKGQLLTPVT